MKDLDFDELDKAVNSLMGDVSKSAPVKKEDDAKTLNISPTLKDDAAPDFSKIEDNASAAITPPAPTASAAPVRPAPAPTASSVHAPSRPPAARRGGRFMDVVHPSSTPKKPSAPVSRQGVTIQPSAKPVEPAVVEAPVAQPEPPTPVIAESPTVEKAKVVDTSTMPSPTTPPENEWPDPLDMAGFKHDDSADNQPLTSPFLADAKVEKRPLGGAPVTEEVAMPAEEPDRAPVLGVNVDEQGTKDDPNDQLPAKPEIETPLPEELQGDLVAIESGSHTSPVPAQPDEQLVQPVTTPVAAEPSKEEAPAPSGPTSIPQQYKEEKSTGEAANGAIYDTDTYHQPLAHPAQKKSGWMWVLWIVAILAVGTAGGAALFFLGVF